MLGAKFVILLVTDEGVGDIMKSALNGLLVSEKSLVALGLGEDDVGVDAPCREDGLHGGCGEGPDTCGAGEKICERVALQAGGGSERDVWKIGGAGNSDLEICGDELFFGLANIGAAF